MNDDELTALAAKAAGITGGAFAPLTDDSDALRLAVALGAKVACRPELTKSYCHIGDVAVREPHGDPFVATRRAIVRAAAELGSIK